jgi:transcriptional regulator with XRE-family HTH domain
MKIHVLKTEDGSELIQLATASGINQGYLSEVENGTKNARPETLEKIARALDLPSGWLQQQTHAARSFQYLAAGPQLPVSWRS